MEDNMDLDKKTYELIAIGASIAGDCQPWLEYHFNAARVAGATTVEINASIEIGKMVREKPKEHMEVLIKKLTENNLDSTCGGWGPK